MTVDADALAARAAALLDTPAGAAALAAAARAVLAHDGAPTRPGGPGGPLADRLARGEPLAEDTDWRSPLGPFRDPHVQAGTLGELCAARLRSGTFAGDLLLALLVPAVRDAAADLLDAARDPAEAETACLAAAAQVVAAGWRARPLRAVLAGDPWAGAAPGAGPGRGSAPPGVRPGAATQR